MTSFTMSAEEALLRFFPSVESFRDRQSDVFDRIWAGRSTLALMPTGTGKSLLFQLPAFASDSVVLVISPLIALMQQQAMALQAAGANVLSLGGSDALEAQRALSKFPWQAGTGFVFISPERAETDGYLEYLLRKHRAAIGLVAIDEAHCVSQWGHDFRPPYKAIPGVLDRAFGRDRWPVTLCLTATLDEMSQQEILHDFRLGRDDVVCSDNMLRTNLDLSFETYPDQDAKLARLDALLSQRRGEKIIVYAHLKQNKKWGTRTLAARYAAQGLSCAPYDADLKAAEREETLERFLDGTLDVVFATGAFGMGVDIPNIRGVVHFLLPESLEQYYQEVGRAGRDGKPAWGVLLYAPINSRVRREMIENSGKTLEDVKKVWDEVCNAGRADLRTLSPWTEFQGKDEEYALFYAFHRIGAVEIVARGPGRLQCFEGKTEIGKDFLRRLASGTAIGNIAAAIRKLNLDPSETVCRLFELYDDDHLRNVRSPDKTLFFRVQSISDDDLAEIVKDVKSKVDKRLRGFDEFVEVVEVGADPSETLRRRFGAA